MKDAHTVRMDDFDMRVRMTPEALYEDPSVGPYVAVHPLADETELLTRLDVSPDTCTKFDCYWKIGDEVYFLQIETAKHADRRIGLWARVSPGEPVYINLVGIVPHETVTRDTVHRVMGRFKDIHVPDLQLGEALQLVGEMHD